MYRYTLIHTISVTEIVVSLSCRVVDVLVYLYTGIFVIAKYQVDKISLHGSQWHLYVEHSDVLSRYQRDRTKRYPLIHRVMDILCALDELWDISKILRMNRYITHSGVFDWYDHIAKQVLCVYLYTGIFIILEYHVDKTALSSATYVCRYIREIGNEISLNSLSNGCTLWSR